VKPEQRGAAREVLKRKAKRMQTQSREWKLRKKKSEFPV
jgi:hypothetical protein